MYLCVLLLTEIDIHFFISQLASTRTLILSPSFTVVQITEESGGDRSDVVTVFYSCANS